MDYECDQSTKFFTYVFTLGQILNPILNPAVKTLRGVRVLCNFAARQSIFLKTEDSRKRLLPKGRKNILTDWHDGRRETEEETEEEGGSDHP
jgi:hypothetical protein